MSAQPKDAKRYTEIRNSKALRDYFVDERFEKYMAASRACNQRRVSLTRSIYPVADGMCLDDVR